MYIYIYTLFAYWKWTCSMTIWNHDVVHETSKRGEKWKISRQVVLEEDLREEAWQARAIAASTAWKCRFRSTHLLYHESIHSKPAYKSCKLSWLIMVLGTALQVLFFRSQLFFLNTWFWVLVSTICSARCLKNMHTYIEYLMILVLCGSLHHLWLCVLQFDSRFCSRQILRRSLDRRARLEGTAMIGWYGRNPAPPWMVETLEL